MSGSAPPPAESRSIPDRSGFGWAPWLLFAAAAWLFLWPCYRAFLNVEIDTNEGWNAYFADAALGRFPLYPSSDKFITNNYPPVSFYIVGVFGRVVGDPILAGRLISLAAVLLIGVMVAIAVRALGGNRAGSAVGAAVFVATISLYFDRYVGMDDPQLLAQAIMAIGFAGFLRAEFANRSCLAPILLMAFAGFVKHNIIAMPLTAFVWLAVQRPREAVKCALIAGVAVAAGFALCYAFYGHDFFTNFAFARQYSWIRTFHTWDDIKSLFVPLAASVIAGCFCWRERGSRFSLLFIAIALGADTLQRTGAGVDQNAAFDLVIAASVGTGLAFTQAGRANGLPIIGRRLLASALVLAILARFVLSEIQGPHRTFRLLFDPSFKTEIATREHAAAAMISQARAIPGPVICTNYVCYRAGKPFTADKFNLDQRVISGSLPPDALRLKIARGEITRIVPDQDGTWEKPLKSHVPNAR